MPNDRVSVAIITKNAEATLANCLESLRGFSEVIVYDNGSIDGTQSVCENFSNVVFHRGDFLGFGPTKRHAASLASNDWVFSIDADETLTENLADSISNLELADPSVAYKVLRHNYFMGEHVAVGGWGNDWLVRLFNRQRCQFNDAPVHEQVDCPPGTQSVALEGVLQHEAVTDIGQFLTKIQRYSELRRKAPGTRNYSAPVILAKSAWAFLRSFVFQAGFMAGWRGLVIAYCASVGTFFKYMKVHADRAVALGQPR